MEQLERTRRYLKRLRQIYAGVPYISDTREYYADDVLSFFIHCYHIKDWIIRLNLLGVTQNDVDEFINAHDELKICADLCNGTKHCELTQRPRTGRQPHLAGRQFMSSGINDEMHTIHGKFHILANGVFHDALDLAERCMQLWDNYVNGLTKSGSHGVERTQ
jgi:hypothetical protein